MRFLVDKFNLFNFISKLATDKDAQNSLLNILNKLFSANKTTSTDNSNVTNPSYYNQNSNVYRSPSSYSLYADMIKRHDEISKNIPPVDKT